MSSSRPSKDNSFVNGNNPYMNELKMHPKVLSLKYRKLQIEDVQGPKKEGSLEARMEKLEQEVFTYKKMAERAVETVYKVNQEIIVEHKKETAELWKDILSLHNTANGFQAQLYDVQNQNCEYEVTFKRMIEAASFRLVETNMSFIDVKSLPWKMDNEEYSPTPSKE